MARRLLIPARATVQRAQVRRADWITPNVVRVVLAGPDIAALDLGSHTDRYVKLLFPHPEVGHLEPLDLRTVRERLPREFWPRTRTYTVRCWDQVAGEIAIDFVQHGEHGVAAPWAASAAVGEQVLFVGPGGGYSPSPTADWHLLIGDETALPAIAVALSRLPADARATVLLSVADAAEQQRLTSAAELDLRWTHRVTDRDGEGLVSAVRELSFPLGTVDAFVHGEATMVKSLRRHLRIERRIAREHLSISGYWRRGNDEESWQAAKAGWNRRLDEEEAAARSSSAGAPRARRARTPR